MTTIRPAQVADAAAIARVHVASWRTSYVGLVPDATLEGLSVERRTERWRETIETSNATRVFVAEAGAGEIAGFVACGPSRSTGLTDGEVYAIYLLAREQRKGLGRALMRAAAEDLHQRGFCGAFAWVLKENHPARGFYSGLGGVVMGEQPIRIGTSELIEVAYGWRTLDGLRQLG